MPGIMYMVVLKLRIYASKKEIILFYSSTSSLMFFCQTLIDVYISIII